MTKKSLSASVRAPGLLLQFVSCLFLSGLLGLVSGCTVTIPIDAWRERYPGEDIHSISETRPSDQVSETEIRELTLLRVEEFAKKARKDFEILDEQLSKNTIQGPDQVRSESLLSYKIIFRLFDAQP